MAHALFLAPTASNVGLTSVALGLVRGLDRLGLRVGFLKPIAQQEEGPERSTVLVTKMTTLSPPEPLTDSTASEMLRRDPDELMEEVVRLYRQAAEDADVVIVEGLVPRDIQAYSGRLNLTMARALDAEVILVSSVAGQTPEETASLLEIVAGPYGGIESDMVPGCILNMVDAPDEEEGGTAIRFEAPAPGPPQTELEEIKARYSLFDNEGFRLLGAIPWNPELIAPRTLDVARFLGAEVIHEGDIEHRRVTRISLPPLPGSMQKLFPPRLLFQSHSDSPAPPSG